MNTTVSAGVGRVPASTRAQASNAPSPPPWNSWCQRWRSCLRRAIEESATARCHPCRSYSIAVSRNSEGRLVAVESCPAPRDETYPPLRQCGPSRGLPLRCGGCRPLRPDRLVAGESGSAFSSCGDAGVHAFYDQHPLVLSPGREHVQHQPARYCCGVTAVRHGSQVHTRVSPVGHRVQDIPDVVVSFALQSMTSMS